MTERPILFSGAMVRAILAGQKTMTRRIVNPQPSVDLLPPTSPFAAASGITGWTWQQERDGKIAQPFTIVGLPAPSGRAYAYRNSYGVPGDRLWVRETWGVGTRPDPAQGWRDGIEYRADVSYLQGESDLLDLYPVTPPDSVELDSIRAGWHPSIHMPRWASRITLEVTGVRVERLQAITEGDARAEGATPFPNNPEGDCWTDGTHRSAFEYLWNETYGWAPNAWQSNPWVWVVEFKRVED